jgi:hypothetical protein
MRSKVTPTLFFNSSSEDRQAVREVLKAGLDCHLSGPLAEQRTPLLVYSSMRFYGLKGVREFIARSSKHSSGKRK